MLLLDDSVRASRDPLISTGTCLFQALKTTNLYLKFPYSIQRNTNLYFIKQIYLNLTKLTLFMKIFIEKENLNKELKFNGTVEELLSKLKINLTSVMVVRNNELVTEDEKLSDSDQIKILSVVSGG